jgi:hypothetical protein
MIKYLCKRLKNMKLSKISRKDNSKQIIKIQATNFSMCLRTKSAEIMENGWTHHVKIVNKKKGQYRYIMNHTRYSASKETKSSTK